MPADASIVKVETGIHKGVADANLITFRIDEAHQWDYWAQSPEAGHLLCAGRCKMRLGVQWIQIVDMSAGRAAAFDTI